MLLLLLNLFSSELKIYNRFSEGYSQSQSCSLSTALVNPETGQTFASDWSR